MKREEVTLLVDISLRSLTEAVNARLAEGWKLHGPVKDGRDGYHQMLKREVGEEDITFNDYQRWVVTKLIPGMSNHDERMAAALGLCGEAGEFADGIKKEEIHGSKFPREAKVKELGDVLFYVASSAHVNQIELEEVMLANVEKLNKRYPRGWDTTRAHSVGESDETEEDR